ncbi:DeoR/GlpR family DNA-binding transcription regulator [Primorskyibacter sp. 2E233]|uniref:DeoR/GlpR family DNA-binding transcription regulator n=1 Tax=Primorskyibacter sp. 2E233 TaxID=3413431 RepID=UPI003BF38BA3
MTTQETVKDRMEADRPRMKKSERRAQILLELKLHPHVRISELSERYGVSTETIRRDFDALSSDGLLNRAHGGATAPSHGHYPSLDERANARIEERERIGRCAAELVEPGETLMIDSGSTTIQLARALAYLGTQCTVLTNSLPVAMTLGHGAAEVILCPGEYLPAESAVVGTDTLEFLARFSVDRCMIGASAMSAEGPSETVRGFAAVKRMMMRRSAKSNLLIDSEKFEIKGLAHVGDLSELDSVIVDSPPAGALLSALNDAKVTVVLAQ